MNSNDVLIVLRNSGGFIFAAKQRQIREFVFVCCFQPKIINFILLMFDSIRKVVQWMINRSVSFDMGNEKALHYYFSTQYLNVATLQGITGVLESLKPSIIDWLMMRNRINHISNVILDWNWWTPNRSEFGTCAMIYSHFTFRLKHPAPSK